MTITRRRLRRAASVAALVTVSLMMTGPIHAEATGSGRNGRIAFADNVGQAANAPELYAVRPDGTGLRRLTHNNAWDACAAYSPDGKLIAYCHGTLPPAPRHLEIWVMRADGHHQRPVTRMGGYAIFPDFAPDGHWIAFSQESADTSTDIWVTSLHGHKVQQVTDTPGISELFPVWSPDGAQLAFLRGPDRRFAPGLGARRVEREGATAHLRRRQQGPTARVVTRRTPDRLQPTGRRSRRPVGDERRRHRAASADHRPNRRLRSDLLPRRPQNHLPAGRHRGREAPGVDRERRWRESARSRAQRRQPIRPGLAATTSGTLTVNEAGSPPGHGRTRRLIQHPSATTETRQTRSPPTSTPPTQANSDSPLPATIPQGRPLGHPRAEHVQ